MIIHLNLTQFNKCLLSTHCVLDTILRGRDTQLRNIASAFEKFTTNIDKIKINFYFKLDNLIEWYSGGMFRPPKRKHVTLIDGIEIFHIGGDI